MAPCAAARRRQKLPPRPQEQSAEAAADTPPPAQEEAVSAELEARHYKWPYRPRPRVATPSLPLALGPIRL